MLSRLLRSRQAAPDLAASKLFNEDTFYPAFMKDLKRCQSELIIECPFITHKRLSQLLPALQKLKEQKVRVVINTRGPHEQDAGHRREETYREVAALQHIGIQVVYTAGHHRKLVVIDRNVLYEGSLNVLSQNNSSEIMRRVESAKLAWEVVRFTGIDKHI